MLYICYLISLNGQNIRQKLKILHFSAVEGRKLLMQLAHEVPLECLQTAISGFQGAHGPGYRGLVATTWVPMGAQVPVLLPSDHPNPSQGRQKGV